MEKSIFKILTGNDEYHSIGFDELNSKKLFLLQKIFFRLLTQNYPVDPVTKKFFKIFFMGG